MINEGKKLTRHEREKIENGYYSSNYADVMKGLSEKEIKTQRKERADKGNKRQKYASNLPPKYKSYLMRANKKGIKFEFSIHDFELMLKQHCVYCGSVSKIGIDRIDSGAGYTLENCVPCCTSCNMMKYTYSQDQFINHVKKIYKYLNLDSQTKLIL